MSNFYFSSNFWMNRTRRHFGLGFFAFPNFLWKTTPSVKKLHPKASLKAIRSQKCRICNLNFFSQFSINRWTEFDFAYIPAKSTLSPLSLQHKIVGLHTFLRNGWTECVLQCKFCPSISQKCVRPLNLVQK